MKFMEKEFPKGTFPKQQTDGAFINEFLANNLDVYAKKIVKDMHFLIIIAGNDSVGNGKSTLATHVGCYLTNKINELHGTDNTFTSENIAWTAKNLVDQSFKMPQYSVNILDEGDDLTTHGMKQAAVELKRYFRKCRQLNQILILIIPSFFELPKFYALARSHALINVRFHGQFERGEFDFYGPNSKKKLYLKGKREWDYSVASPDFPGGFFGQYTFFPNVKEETERYKKKKYKDMVDDKEEQEKQLTPQQVERRITADIVRKMLKGVPKLTQLQIAAALGLNRNTICNYVNDELFQKIEK